MEGPPADGHIEQDARGVITGWNAGSERLFGWTAAEAVGMPSHRLIPARNHGRHSRTLEGFIDAPAGSIQRQQITAVHRDGHEFQAEFTISFERGDDGLRSIAAVRAIEAETRGGVPMLRGARYRAILDQIEDGCCVVDFRGRYLFVNDAFCRIYGFDKREILGSNFELSSGPERAGMLREMYTQVYRTGQPIKAFEYEITPRNGPPVFVEQSISLERDARGQPIGFLAITRDCTERMRAQQELAKAKEAADAANLAKSQFLANMSHEIRTPMHGIIGMTAVALDSAPPPMQAEHLQTIRSQAESLLVIVNDILDFSKIESRYVELEAIPFPLTEAVEQVVAALDGQARAKGLTLSHSIATDVPPYLVGDPTRLKQIVSNVVGNAVKFTDTGSVALDVTLDERGGDRVLLHIRVIDSGIGIPDDKRAAIFEPFRQADGSTTRRFGGTGLGLSIASSLVDLLGGQIWVDSRPGIGSTFHVTLPMTIGAPPIATTTAATADAASPRPAGGSRILVAEDNIVNQRIAASLLTKRGHTVTVVGNGREAVDAVRRDVFDLVLMDVQMPEMDGFEATAAIRQGEQETGRRVRIIAMTAHAMIGDRERCLAAGMDGYLSKPIDQRTLYDLIEQ
jgi:PAS domain S-box-containing protein